MKKIILFSLFILLSSLAFAYDYPATFVELLQQYADAREEVTIITNQSNTSCIHVGIIRLVQDDYILFYEKGDLIILCVPNIVELHL